MADEITDFHLAYSDGTLVGAFTVDYADFLQSLMSGGGMIYQLGSHTIGTDPGSLTDGAILVIDFDASLTGQYAILVGPFMTGSAGWGIALPALGLNPHSFGSFVLTNIGSVGLDIGYPSLLPFSNVSAVVALGKVNTKPGIIEGKIVPGRMVQVSASIDHRLVDAQHIGLLFRFLKSAVKNPQQFE